MSKINFEVGQEAVYLYGSNKIHVPVILTAVMEQQCHARHRDKSIAIKFIPKDRLRPKGYNSYDAEGQTPQAPQTK